MTQTHYLLITIISKASQSNLILLVFILKCKLFHILFDALIKPVKTQSWRNTFSVFYVSTFYLVAFSLRKRLLMKTNDAHNLTLISVWNARVAKFSLFFFFVFFFFFFITVNKRSFVLTLFWISVFFYDVCAVEFWYFLSFYKFPLRYNERHVRQF